LFLYFVQLFQHDTSLLSRQGKVQSGCGGIPRPEKVKSQRVLKRCMVSDLHVIGAFRSLIVAFG
jgi:hypothetical protein